MALLTKKEFRTKCGLTPNMFRVYRGRNKFAMSGDYIDDSIEPNKTFIAQRVEFLANKASEDDAESAVPNVKPPKLAKSDAGNGSLNTETPSVDQKPTFANPAALQLEEQKKLAEIERIKSTTRLNELRIQKQEGELIPAELVKPLLAQLAKSLSAAFKSGADNLIVEISHKKKLTLDETADLRARLTFEINESIKKGVNDAKRQAKRISDDFASKR